MLPPTLLVHHCTSCLYNTSIPSTAFQFSQDCFCSHCGALTEGVNIHGQIPDMQQDELSELFAKSMQLQQRQAPTPAPPPAPGGHQQEQQTRTYPSAHYHHSSHLAADHRSSLEPAPTSFPATVNPQPAELESVLLRNSIDPKSLFPSQIILFQNADGDQKLRLLELWRICPPDYGIRDLMEQGVEWPQTDLRQEEEMAKARWERTMQRRRMEGGQEKQRPRIREQYVDEDDMEVGKGESPTEQRVGAEPYKANGDHVNGWYHQSTDPVYQSPAGLWETSAAVHGVRKEGEGSGFYGEFVGMHGLEEDMVM